MSRNRHPADQLADVRAEIKALETREQQLRGQLLATAHDRIGDEWVAEVQNCEQRRLDAQACIRRFGTAALAPYFSITRFPVVKLRPRRGRG
jgi:hypothetical protein